MLDSAGIGKLPNTVADRSIPIRMKRRAPGEVVARCCCDLTPSTLPRAPHRTRATRWHRRGAGRGTVDAAVRPPRSPAEAVEDVRMVKRRPGRLAKTKSQSTHRPPAGHAINLTLFRDNVADFAAREPLHHLTAGSVSRARLFGSTRRRVMRSIALRTISVEASMSTSTSANRVAHFGATRFRLRPRTAVRWSSHQQPRETSVFVCG